MTIHVVRYAHFSNDAIDDNFRDLIRKSDVFLLENPIGDDYEDAKRFYNDISFKGFSHSRPPIYDTEGFRDSLNSLLMNCKKPVEVEKSPLTHEQSDRWEKMSNLAHEAFASGRFEEACKLRLEETEYFFKLNMTRENCLERQLPELQEQNPGKEVLFPIGGGHMIYSKLKKKGEDVKQTLIHPPIIMDHQSEFMRRKELEFKIPKELIGRMFSSDLLFSYLKDENLPLNAKFLKARRISDKLSLEDLKELSEYIVSDFSRRKYPVEASIIWMRKRGINI